MEKILWTYLRVRLETSIPDIDTSIAPGELTQIGTYERGIMLGKGSFGEVFTIEDVENPDDSTNQVIKSVPKSGINMDGLKTLKNEILAMQLVTKQWQHRNIVQLFRVHHSHTHIFLRMEFGGPENLHRRLFNRDASGDQAIPLPLDRATSIISQCVAVLTHMHLGPMIAHRDIKPANITLTETDEGVVIKLVDFGLAKRVSKAGTKSRASCGTLPFMAPELVLEETHDVLAGDIWSMGVVFLEIFCFVHFVPCMIFKVQGGKCKGGDKTVMMERLRDYFQTPEKIPRLLDAHLRPELEDLLPHATSLMGGMLKFSPDDRWSAKEIVFLPDEVEVDRLDKHGKVAETGRG